MTERRETFTFQAEAQEVLSLMIHALYKHEDIFLRELVSNASDALDKLRIEALTKPDLGLAPEDLGIRIEVDRAQRTLSVEDNGVGMNREELVQNLGTIARSGTKQFLEKLRAAKSKEASSKSKAGGASPSAGAAELPEFIGQFGVGFYSSFIVADEVVVETLRAGEKEALRWTSRGKGEYTIEPSDKAGHGTRVTLHLSPSTEEHARDEFLSEWTIKDIVRRYSDFVAYPIRMEVEQREPKAGGKEGEFTTERRIETLNSMKPLWSRKKDEITKAEYDEFYHHITHDWEEPLEVVHFKAEGTTEYTALLYVPSSRPLDLFEGAQPKSRLSLYVKRVLIMPECEDLLPPWMRFVRGLVDAPDLPLNVSREVLQRNPVVRQIQKRLVKRVLESLARMLEEDRPKYRRFWDAFGTLMKEGIYVGADEDQSISKIALFETSHRGPAESPADAAAASLDEEGAVTTLGEYVARMKPDQRAIYYITGADRRALTTSPHLEAFEKRGLEVLYMVDPVDEWLLERLREFDGKPLQPIDRGELELDGAAEKEAREVLEREHRDMLAALERELAQDVKSVRFTNRLTDSPAVLVSEPGALSPNMERILRAARQEVRRDKRILELNPDHPLIRRLEELHAQRAASEEFREYCELLYAQALLAEGSPLSDAARFAKLLSKLMIGSSHPAGAT
jgi:molecular chaperone HtpG